MSEERKSWLLLGVLFLSNFFVIGSTSAITGVFLTPLVRHFGWTRTLAASLTMLIALTGALAGPITGRLLDSLAAQKVMSVGVALTALALARGGAGQFLCRDGGGAHYDWRRDGGVDDYPGLAGDFELVRRPPRRRARDRDVGDVARGFGHDVVRQLSDHQRRLALGLHHPCDPITGAGDTDCAADSPHPARRQRRSGTLPRRWFPRKDWREARPCADAPSG